jgi:hypothetical protein
MFSISKPDRVFKTQLLFSKTLANSVFIYGILKDSGLSYSMLVTNLLIFVSLYTTNVSFPAAFVVVAYTLQLLY